jgi:hypothetical protein
MSRVRVTIDRIVLKGFQAGGGNAIAESLRTELSRVLADQAAHGEWARSQRTPALRPAPITLTPGTEGGRKVGRGLARTIGRALRP